MGDHDVDVLVVGAGLAGLSTADALAPHRTVEVWEARDRVGGRTETVTVDGAALDLGAQWLGPTQERMHALARRFDLVTFPTWTTGRSVLVDGDDRRTFRGTVPLLGPVQLARMALALQRTKGLARAVGPDVAVGSASRDALDARTLAAVLDGPLGRGQARRVVDTAVRVIFGAEPEELSAAWVAAYAAAGGGDLLALAAVDGGAQQTRLVGGTQAFARALAADLDVTCDRAVARIARDADGVVVTAQDGTARRAGHVVVAVPPALLDRIEHDPPLPGRTALGQRMPTGATAKVFALYETAFWRDEGLCGEAVLTDGPVQVVFDATSADGGVPALLAFVTGAAAHHLAGAGEDVLHDVVRTALTRAFGPRAGRPSRMVSRHWSTERWSAGCPTANLVPGAATAHAAHLRAPAGRLHLAGTETSTDWTGYMEGAVASGRRAAQELLAAARP